MRFQLLRHEVEANINGLGRMHRLDSIGGERMQRGGQQAWLLFGEDFGDSALAAARPGPLVRHLIAPE